MSIRPSVCSYFCMYYLGFQWMDIYEIWYLFETFIWLIPVIRNLATVGSKCGAVHVMIVRFIAGGDLKPPIKGSPLVKWYGVFRIVEKMQTGECGKLLRYTYTV